MSEELNAPQVAPAEPIAAPAATPVVPEPIPAPEVPSVTPPNAEQPSEPAAAEQAQASGEGNELPPPPESIPAEQPSAPAENQEVTVSDELVEKAIELIKNTGRSSSVFLQRNLEIDLAHVEALLDELVIKGIVGERKDPKNPMSARKILIECAAPAPTIKVKPKPHANKNARPRITDFDRMQMWKKHLQEIGGYKNEALIDGICAFAQKNPGFNPQAKWGSCLIVMVNRFAGKCRDSLRTFSVTDAEYMMREMLRFMTEQPLGDGPQVWNTKFQTNMEQRAAVSEFWGINKKFAEMRGKQCSVMTAVRDAAWPTREEEAKGTGGSYAERLHYLVMCLVAFGSSDHFNDLIEPGLHNEPTDRFLERVGGRPRQAAPKVVEWYRDGKCLECGFDVTTDSNGNTVCSNPICMKHFAAVATSFANEAERPQEPQTDAPAPRKGNWKKRDRHDHGDGEDLRGFSKKGNKKGKRYRVNDDDDVGDADPEQHDGKTVISIGGKGFSNTPFADLQLPTGDEAQS